MRRDATRTALMRPAYHGHEACARLLIDAEAAVDAAANNGHLRDAACGRSRGMRRLLIDAKAAVDAADTGMTAGHARVAHRRGCGGGCASARMR